MGRTRTAHILSPEIIVRRLSVLSALICGWGRQLHRYTLVGGLVFLIDLVSYWLLMTVGGPGSCMPTSCPAPSAGPLASFSTATSPSAAPEWRVWVAS